MLFQAVLWFFALVSSLMFFSAFEAHLFALSVFLISLCLTVSVARALQTDGLSVPRSPLVDVGFAFWVLAFISVVLSEARFESFLYFWLFSALPLSFLVFLLPPAPEKFLKAGAICFGIFISFLAISSLVQFVFLREMLVHDMVFWPLSNPNALAALLSLGLFGALGWLLVAEKKLHSNGALVLCFLLVAALFVSGSKAAFFALVLVLPIFVFLNLAHVKKHWHCMAWLGGGVALLFVVAVLSGAAMPEKLVSMGSELGMKSLHLRFVIWAGAWEMIRDHFWTGTGIGTFFLYYPEYRGKDFISAGLMAHNDPLQFWAEMGVVAPLLFYGFIVLAVTRTVKTLKVLKSDDPQRVMIVTPFCAFAALIVHSHVSFPFYVLSILLSAGFFLALWFWATEKNLEEGGYVIVLPQSWRSQTIWAACFLPFVLLMSVFVAAAGSEILLQRAQMASMKGDMQGFASDVNAASKLSQRMNAKAFILAVSVPMGILESEQSSLSASQKDDLYKQASALLDKAQDLNPRLADSFYQEALLAKLVQKDAEIENLLLEALRVNPLHVAARRKLASYYQMAGRKEEALNVLREGLDWPYRQEAAIGFYQQAAGTFLENGDMVEHKKAMKKMGVYVHQRRQGQE